MLLNSCGHSGAQEISFPDFLHIVKSQLDKYEAENGGPEREAFDHLDVDGSGAISVEELQSVLSSLGFSAEEQHTELIKQVDSNNSGEIDWPEFKSFLLLLKKRNIATQIEASAREVFSQMDLDGSGALCRDEIALALSQVTGKAVSQEEVDEFVEAVDHDGTGQIEFEEFMEMLVTMQLEPKQPENSEATSRYNGALFDKLNSDIVPPVLSMDLDFMNLLSKKKLEVKQKTGLPPINKQASVKKIAAMFAKISEQI